jgi:2-iminobutanoate/2-iminopropanoate deaminase
MTIAQVQTPHAPAAVGPYSQAIIANGMVFTAGQVALLPETGELVEGGIEVQTMQALRNLRAVLEAAGASPANVVKTTVFLQNMNDFAAMNGVYAAFFQEAGGIFPARSTVEVAKLPKGALVEIEAVALL